MGALFTQFGVTSADLAAIADATHTEAPATRDLDAAEVLAIGGGELVTFWG